jgi:hypothetical protein
LLSIARATDWSERFSGPASGTRSKDDIYWNSYRGLGRTSTTSVTVCDSATPAVKTARQRLEFLDNLHSAISSLSTRRGSTRTMARTVVGSAVVVRQKYYWPDVYMNVWTIIMLTAASTVLGIFAQFMMIQSQTRQPTPW